MTYLLFILLLNVLIILCVICSDYYAYCCILALLLAFLGWSGTLLGTSSYWEISLILFFLGIFQMARIILNIETDMAYEPDLLNCRIILHVVDRVPTITITNDLDFSMSWCSYRTPCFAFLFGIFIRHFLFCSFVRLYLGYVRMSYSLWCPLYMFWLYNM